MSPELKSLLDKYRFAKDRPTSLPTEGKTIAVEWDDMLSLVAAIETISSLVEPNVTVKIVPLKWKKYGSDYLCKEWGYRLSKYKGKWGISPIDWPAFEYPYATLNDAKAAVQEEHEPHIRSCIEIVPSTTTDKTLTRKERRNG